MICNCFVSVERAVLPMGDAKNILAGRKETRRKEGRDEKKERKGDNSKHSK